MIGATTRTEIPATRTRAFALVVAVAAAVTLTACDGAGEDAPTSAGAFGDPVLGPVIVAGSAGLEDYLDCLSRERITLVSAHRGGPAPGYPANAIATLAHTFSRAPVMLEIDVQQTADDELVLLHDDDLARRTSCDGRVDHATWPALQACRLRDPNGRTTDHHVARLADALAWAEGRTVLQLDIKRSVSYERLIEEVRLADAEDRVILITYSVGAASRLSRLAPDLIISAPVDSLGELGTLRNRRVDPDQLVAWTGTERTNPALYDQLDAREVPVIFGTLGPSRSSIDGAIARSGEESRYRDIAADGVDILGTDRPIEAYDALFQDRDPSLALETCRRHS